MAKASGGTKGMTQNTSYAQTMSVDEFLTKSVSEWREIADHATDKEKKQIFDKAENRLIEKFEQECEPLNAIIKASSERAREIEEERKKAMDRYRTKDEEIKGKVSQAEYQSFVDEVHDARKHYNSKKRSADAPGNRAWNKRQTIKIAYEEKEKKLADVFKQPRPSSLEKSIHDSYRKMSYKH